MALFAARRIADNARAGGVALFQRQPRQPADDGLQLVVIRRAVHGEGNQRAQRAKGLGQIAHPARRLEGSGFSPSDFQAA